MNWSKILDSIAFYTLMAFIGVFGLGVVAFFIFMSWELPAFAPMAVGWVFIVWAIYRATDPRFRHRK
jgi:hypothetical protein